MTTFHAAIGAVVATMWHEPNWAVLDAVADLLTDHAVTRDRHQRDMDETVRDVASDARESYSRGVLDERDRHDMWGPDR